MHELVEMSFTQPSDLEKESLEAHVDLCALRYEQMERRLTTIDDRFEKIEERFDSVEQKLVNIETDYKRGNTQIIVGLIAATATIIAAVIAAIATIAT